MFFPVMLIIYIICFSPERYSSARTFTTGAIKLLSCLFLPPPPPLPCISLQIYPAMDIDGASSVVLQALTQATSQDTAVLKPAEEQLRQWETQPGFYSVLLVGMISNNENKSTAMHCMSNLEFLRNLLPTAMQD